MAKVKSTKRRLKKNKPPRGVVRTAVESVVFLPDCLAQVKAIAWRGLSDDEIAEMFGVDKELFQIWKKTYPSFRTAIEEGRTHADSKVVEALYKRATGYDYEDQVVGRSGVRTLRRHAIPDVDAAKFWLKNRQKAHWSDRHSLDGGGRSGGGTNPIEIQDTKTDLIRDILKLVQPKPDGETKPDLKT